MKITEIRLGQKVHFKHNELAKGENGIVKEIPEGKRWVRVVFKCGDDWENYEKYTGALTDVSTLKDGWV